jgi:hypothetical protein
MARGARPRACLAAARTRLSAARVGARGDTDTTRPARPRTTTAHAASRVRRASGARSGLLAAARPVGRAAGSLERLGRVEPQRHRPAGLGGAGVRQLRAGTLRQRAVLPSLRYEAGLGVSLSPG